MGFPLVPHLDLYDGAFSMRCENGLRPGNPNPTNPTYPTYPTNPTNPTNPTTKYHCEFVNLFCIYADFLSSEVICGLLKA